MTQIFDVMGCLSTNDDSIFVREKDIERLTATTAEMVGPKVAIRFDAAFWAAKNYSC